jgi:hypothetical protein
MRRRQPAPHDPQADLELIMQTLMRLGEQLDRIERTLEDDDGWEEEEGPDTGADG